MFIPKNVYAFTLMFLVLAATSLGVSPVSAQFLGQDFVTGNADGATASGTPSMADGTTATASGNGSTALGNTSTASNTNSTAVGDSATASGSGSTAIGKSASASKTNSAAFGNAATAANDNQQVFGTSSNIYTMPGVISAASQAAQSGSTRIVTADSSGNLAATPSTSLGLASAHDIAAINAKLSMITVELSRIKAELNSLSHKISGPKGSH